jgi:hypothetical protein
MIFLNRVGEHTVFQKRELSFATYISLFDCRFSEASAMGGRTIPEIFLSVSWFPIPYVVVIDVDIVVLPLGGSQGSSTVQYCCNNA